MTHSEEKPSLRELPDILAMGTMIFDPIWSERMHDPQEAELLWVVEGSMELVTEDGVFPAEEGEILVVAPGTLHRDSFDLDVGLGIFYTAFDWVASPELFSVVDNRRLGELSKSAKAELLGCLGRLRAGLSSQSGMDQLIAQSRLHTLLLLLHRFCSEASDSSEGCSRRMNLVVAAKDYLEDHYSECIELQDIAHALNVSPYHLSRVFSQESEFSLFAYLNRLRVEKAKALLGDVRLNVTEVARQVGFDNANYFSKVFRKYCGISPSQYAART